MHARIATAVQCANNNFGAGKSGLFLSHWRGWKPSREWRAVKAPKKARAVANTPWVPGGYKGPGRFGARLQTAHYRYLKYRKHARVATAVQCAHNNFDAGKIGLFLSHWRKWKPLRRWSRPRGLPPSQHRAGSTGEAMGPWSNAEHAHFEQGSELHGRRCAHVQTRSALQAKYFGENSQRRVARTSGVSRSRFIQQRLRAGCMCQLCGFKFAQVVLYTMVMACWQLQVTARRCAGESNAVGGTARLAG